MTEDELKTAYEDFPKDRRGLLTFILCDIARQLTITNEIATRRHQIEYALAFQKDDKINFAVDPPLDLATPGAPPMPNLIKCLDCDYTSNEENFQVLNKRGDYLKCPKCGALDNKLSDFLPPTPAPDAPTDVLVEAVKKFLDNELSQQGNIIRKHGTWTRVAIDCLCSALADHEKAVT